MTLVNRNGNKLRKGLRDFGAGRKSQRVTQAGREQKTIWEMSNRLQPIQVYLFRLLCSVILCATLVGCSLPTTNSKSGTAVNVPWDWSGIIGTGQSLSVGARGLPVLSTNQPYHNLKLS